jgi:hypothetical protein
MRAEEEQTSTSVSSSNSAYFDREIGWLRADARKVHRLTLALLGALVLDLIVIGALATGPINVFHNDALWMLDNGWRVLNGQAPHHDFYTPLGTLPFFVIAGGMALAKDSAQGLSIGIALFGFVIGLWGWLLSRRRMPAVFAVLVTAWLALTATCPTPLGFTPSFLSLAMIHNRWGYALLGIILIECAFARVKPSWQGGLSSGVAFVLLAFLKLNFFGVAGVLLLATVPIMRSELLRFFGFLIGTAVTITAFCLYPHFSLSAFFSDMSFVLHAHGTPLTFAATVSGIATCAKSGNLWLVLAMTLAIVALIVSKRGWDRQMATLTALSFLVLASGPLFLQTNSLENRCELASLWIIILLERVTALHLEITEHKMVTLVLVAASLGGIVSSLIPEASSTLTLLSYQTEAQKTAGLRIAAPGMENVRFYDSTALYDKVKAGDGDGTNYVNCINDGLGLLNSRSGPDESMLALGFYNPFSYLLRRKPAEGGSSFLYLGTSISESHMPTVERVFGNADLMILPQYEGTHRISDQFIQDYYRSYLLENFHFVAKSQCWSLYRRNR